MLIHWPSAGVRSHPNSTISICYSNEWFSRLQTWTVQVRGARGWKVLDVFDVLERKTHAIDCLKCPMKYNLVRLKTCFRDHPVLLVNMSVWQNRWLTKRTLFRKVIAFEEDLSLLSRASHLSRFQQTFDISRLLYTKFAHCWFWRFARLLALLSCFLLATLGM